MEQVRSMIRLSHSLCAGFTVALIGSAGLEAQVVVLRSLPSQGFDDYVDLLGDLDGDGVREVAVAHRGAPTITSVGIVDVYSPRTGAVVVQLPLSTAWPINRVFRTGDHDGDGRDDIATEEWNLVAGTLTIRLAVRSGVNGNYLLQLPLGLRQPTGVVFANADPVPDFMVRSDGPIGGTLLYPGLVEIIDGTSLQVIRSHVGTVANQGLGTFDGLGDVGDFDGDGVTDYLLGDGGPFAPLPSYRLFSARTGALLAVVPRLSATYGLGVCGIGDANADGFDDLILRDQGNPPLFGVYAVHVLAGPALGQTPTLWSHVWSMQAPGPVLYPGNAARIGDIDGDGHCDIALSGGAVGMGTTILAGRDQTVIREISLGFPAGVAQRTDSPGDIDDDGVPDLMMRREFGSTSAILYFVSGACPGVTFFGNACVDGTGRQPRIGVGVGARLGKTMTVNLSNANPALLAATLAIGFDSTTWAGSPLPLDLTFIGMPGCNWYLTPDAVLTKPTIGVNGTRHHATHEVPVPQQSALLGLHLYSQWLILEAGPGGLTGSTTRAARSTVVP
jgi:hypothetical protein